MSSDNDLANSLLIGSQQSSVGACERHNWQYPCMSLRQQLSVANQRLTVCLATASPSANTLPHCELTGTSISDIRCPATVLPKPLLTSAALSVKPAILASKPGFHANLSHNTHFNSRLNRF